MKEKIIIGILIAALVAGGSAGGAVYYKKSHQKTVSVVSVTVWPVSITWMIQILMEILLPVRRRVLT